MTGNDLGQVVTVTTGTGPTTGLIAQGSANNSLAAPANALCAVISPANAAAAASQPYLTISGSAGLWSVKCATAPAASTTLVFNIVTIG